MSSVSLPKGKEEPRLWTQPLRKLSRHTSLGFECIRFAETALGIELLPWQKFWLIHALEVTGPIADRNLRFRIILTLVGRQCGKTTLLMIVTLWQMYTGMSRLVLGSAQQMDIAREAWTGVLDMIKSDPELNAEIDHVRRTNGDFELKLANGARYRLSATNRGAGRGLSVDLLIMDEIREQRDWLAWAALSKTTSARTNGLIVAISNAGDDASVVLNQLRETALAESDPSLAIFEWSAADGSLTSDWEAIAQGSPALGYTLSYDSVKSSLASDPPNIFRTEVMCMKVESVDTPISPVAWDSCADTSGSHVMEAEEKWFCLDVSVDGEHATLAAATVGSDQKVRVGIVQAWEDLGDVRRDLPGLLADHRPRKVAWFPGGPGAALLADMTMLTQVLVDELKGDVPAICQEFAEQVHSRQLIHGNDPLLSAHVKGSQRLLVGDGWRFARRGGHADAAYAAAGAVHLARVAKPRVKLKLYTAKSA